ncbi:MAG: hypothetical protein Q4G28_06455 [Neisseria sp.]|nr:hypothetical protein [Neisseria sp.]
MMKTVFYSLLMLPALAWAQATSYLHIAEPLRFDGRNYYLQWSANSAPGYYKEEFLPRGQTPERYRNMLIVDWLQTNISPQQAMQRKVAELQQLKAAGHQVSWQAAAGDEPKLDFIMVARVNGEPVIEHNLYRYRAATAAGKRAVVLFAASRRAYGEADIKRFADKLPTEGSAFSRKAQALPFPVVNVK